MAKTYSLYEAATGLFTGERLHCDEDELLAVRLPAGTLAMEGAFDHLSQRIERGTGSVVAYHPPTLSSDQEWGTATRRLPATPVGGEAQDRRTAVLARIQALESKQGRSVREATLGDPAALKRLREIDAEIAVLRTELESM